MRALSGVEERLARWDGAGDPYTPAIELGEHHQVSLFAAREAALDAVVARGGFAALPTRLDQAVWHWGMVRSLGGPDLRDAVAAKFLHDGYFRDAPHISWTAALPFLHDRLRRRASGWGSRRPSTRCGRATTSRRRGCCTRSRCVRELAAPYARAWSAWAPRRARARGWTRSSAASWATASPTSGRCAWTACRGRTRRSAWSATGLAGLHE